MTETNSQVQEKKLSGLSCQRREQICFHYKDGPGRCYKRILIAYYHLDKYNLETKYRIRDVSEITKKRQNWFH